jgi:hypothetical protein
MKTLNTIVWVAIATSTAIIGYQIHHSIGWAILDFIFWPIAWIKWLICHEVNLTIIKQAFEFFLK